MFDESQFAEGFAPGEVSPLDILLEGGRVPGRLFAPRGKPRALVIGFHGAVRREAHTLPVYFPRYACLTEDCYQYHPCDPEIFAHANLQTSWFAGSRERPLQSLLPRAFRELAKRLKVARVIYVGASAGGFAALFYSRFHPRSISIALQPQTDVYTYDRERAQEYERLCWPPSEGEKTTRPMLKLNPVYSKRRRNTVIYMQSSGDWHHYRYHFLPFYEQLRRHPERMLFTCDAWDPPGHRPVPQEILFRWMRAAVEAETPKAQEILAARYRAQNLSDAQAIEDERDSSEEIVATPSKTEDANDTQELSRELTKLLLAREV